MRENDPRAARACVLVSITDYDAMTLPTYPIFDCPSRHACMYCGTSAMLAYLFPHDAAFFHSRAEEQAASRPWAGIHFRSACEAGVQLGRDVAQEAIAWAQGDGADSA